jgi:ABC-type antimicrobial peptide transport system permease subunit
MWPTGKPVNRVGVEVRAAGRPGELVAMILREAAALTVPGFVIGVFFLIAFGRVMRSFVYQLSPLDPISVTIAGFFLVILTLFAAWLPARRAAAVDPATALRIE